MGDKFYVVEPGGDDLFGTKWAYGLTLPPENYEHATYCPVCHRPATLRHLLPPINLKISRSHPNGWGDLLWGAGFFLMVSKRFKEIYEAEQLSGIEAFEGPVNILKYGTKKPDQIQGEKPVYYHIKIPWGGANQDDQLSKLTYLFRSPKDVYCAFCRGETGASHRVQENVIIEKGSWNGDDLFIPRGAPVELMVSEKFRRVVDQYDITNILLIPGEIFSFDGRYLTKWRERIEIRGKYGYLKS